MLRPCPVALPSRCSNPRAKAAFLYCWDLWLELRSRPPTFSVRFALADMKSRPPLAPDSRTANQEKVPRSDSAGQLALRRLRSGKRRETWLAGCTGYCPCCFRGSPLFAAPSCLLLFHSERLT